MSNALLRVLNEAIDRRISTNVRRVDMLNPDIESSQLKYEIFFRVTCVGKVELRNFFRTT